MEELIRYFREYEVWIYLILGVCALFFMRKFVLAWEELRGAAFGMERESAQARLNQWAIFLILTLMVAVAEFSLVSFIAPTIPGAVPIPTSTIDFLATATTTPMIIESAAELTPVATLNPIIETAIALGCTQDQIMITSPQNGDVVKGVVKIIGTASIPNFGFYKYEIARPGETIWLSINAGQDIVEDGELGEWSTSVLPPGEYNLRLVVSDNQGKMMPPCEIRVQVVVEEE